MSKDVRTDINLTVITKTESVMKTRIVMWGTNEKDEKVLIAISLRAAENAVDIYEFPVNSTTEEFYNLMLKEWRELNEVPFPDDFKHTVRPLTASDHILPEELKIERPDIVIRAQTEWHFIVLSHKLYETYRKELEDMKSTIAKAESYSGQLWDEMKQIWAKIQNHIVDNTLLREHTAPLKDLTNDIFTQLKDMRKELDAEYDKVSNQVAITFNERLDKIDQKLKSGLGLKPLFDELKRIQGEFKTAKLNRIDRNNLWKRIDATFKNLKENKPGDRGPKDSTIMDRLQRRYDGLLAAIDKMEKSINFDNRDRLFEDSRITNTEGQLEAQIRMAKLKMINERITSKKEKLDEMLKTKSEIEQRLERERKRQEEFKKQQALKDELQGAKEIAKQKIAESIQASTTDQDEETLRKAAAAIVEQQEAIKRGKENALSSLKNTVGSSLEDLSTTLGAVASVVADKVADLAKEVKEEAKEALEDLSEGAKKVSEKSRDLSEEIKSQFSEAVREGKEEFTEAKDKFSDFTANLKDGNSSFSEKAANLFDKVKEELREAIEEGKEEFKEAKEKLADLADDVTDKLSEKVSDAKEEGKSLFDKVSDFAGNLSESVKEKLNDLNDDSAEDNRDSDVAGSNEDEEKENS